MKIKIVAEVEMDDSWVMSDADEKLWFDRDVMNGGNLFVMERGDYGDELGKVNLISWEHTND